MPVEIDSPLFPKVFVGCLSAYEKVRSKVSGWYFEAAFAVTTDVLVDLAELCSYARFMSEYRDRPQLWEFCTKRWNDYFDKHADPPEAVAWFTKILGYRQERYLHSARQGIRMHWERVLRDVLVREGAIIEDVYWYPWREDDPESTESVSPLLREVCRSGAFGMSWPGPDIFVFAYLAKHPRAKRPIDYPDRHGMAKVFGVAMKRDEDNDEEGG